MNTFMFSLHSPPGENPVGLLCGVQKNSFEYAALLLILITPPRRFFGVLSLIFCPNPNMYIHTCAYFFSGRRTTYRTKHCFHISRRRPQSLFFVDGRPLFWKSPPPTRLGVVGNSAEPTPGCTAEKMSTSTTNAPAEIWRWEVCTCRYEVCVYGV